MHGLAHRQELRESLCERNFRWNIVAALLRGKTGIGWNVPHKRRAHSRLVRNGKMMAQGLKQAEARLEVQRALWVEVLPSDSVQEIAEGLPERYGLWALICFHLAAALDRCKE
jgi:hypothetical protein